MKSNSMKSPLMPPNRSPGVIRWLLREILGCLLVAALLFWVADRLDWGMGWALVGLYVIWVAANALILIPRSPELLVERVTHRFGDKTWDNVILGIYGVMTLLKLVVAALDYRYAWSPPIAIAWQIGGLVVAALGYALVTWAMSVNTFFAMANRIQHERGHEVVREGPYHYVRHPGYVGSIVFELATPIMLGSLWALIPGGISALLMIVRTAIEDRSLHTELAGYDAYAQQTRYRLLPGVW